MTKKEMAINEKISELIHLLVMINNNTGYCTFISFSGHVNSFSFEICESKDNYNRILVKEEFYFDRDEAHVIPKLNKAITFMKNILETNRINFAKLQEKRAVHTTYALFKS